MNKAHNENEQLEDIMSALNNPDTELSQAYDQITTKLFKEGQTPQDALQVDKKILENIYAQAYRLYNTGKYTDAIHLFRMLILLNSMETKYVLGLAASFQMIKEYKNAIQTYTVCSVLEPHNPLPHYHSSECFIQLNDDLSAMVSLELTIARCESKPEYKIIKERSLLTLQNLKNKIKKNN